MGNATVLPHLNNETLVYFSSLEMALAEARRIGETEAFVIGGGEIYGVTLPLTDRLYITLVHAPAPPATDYAGDTFFPKFDAVQWQVVSREDHGTHEYLDYERKNNGKQRK